MGVPVAESEPERLRRKIEETSQAVLAFSRQFDLGGLLQGIVDQACRLAEAQCGALGIVVSPDAPMHPWVFAGVPAETVERIGRYPRPVGVLGEVALFGRTVRTRDVKAHPAFGGFPAHHFDLTSLLGVPIPFEGRSVGVLYLGNKRGAEEFTDEDQHIIELLAAHAGAHVAQARLRAEIAADRSQLRAILEHARHAILYFRADGQVVANPAAEALLDHSFTAPAPADYRSLLCHPDGTPISGEDWPPSRALRGEAVPPTELCVVQPGGRSVPVRLEATPVHGPGGDILGAVIVVEDLTTAKDIQRLREEFAAIIAHDLRNPVSTIQLQTEHLLRGAKGDEIAVPVDALRRMHRAAARLTEMVTDLLDASRIEIQRLALAREAVSVPMAVARCLSEISLTLGNHEADVRVEGDPPPALADPLRLDQILTNLLDNAAKFSPAGTAIRITITSEGSGTAIEVTDSGTGIAPEEMPHLFDRFYQAKRAREKKSGLGLGLYITKGLVEAHGGRISVSSAPGRGSTFHVWLPAAPVIPAAPEGSNPAP